MTMNNGNRVHFMGWRHIIQNIILKKVIKTVSYMELYKLEEQNFTMCEDACYTDTDKLSERVLHHLPVIATVIQIAKYVTKRWQNM
jgi:hypothetical protein